MDRSMPGFPVLHCLLEFAQTYVLWVGDAIQPSHPLLLSSPSALDLSQHQGLFQWVSSSHQVTNILELQHQSFQWIFRVNFRKAVTNLDSVLKSKVATLPTKVHIVKAMVFPGVMYKCESWTIKKAEHQKMDAFELWCWRTLEGPLDRKRSTSQS